VGAADQAAYTLRYRSQRRDIWNWYWQRWRAALWRRWLLIGSTGVATFLFFTWLDHRPLVARDLAFALCFALLVFAFFVVYPQLAFKSQERVLTAGPDGIESSIGEKHGQHTWHDIDSIVDKGDAISIVIKHTGNAFVIPARAFTDMRERTAFLEAITAWHQAAI
jgi:hypothetical protein